MSRLIRLSLGAWLLSGCGPSPAEQCEFFIETACQRLRECGEERAPERAPDDVEEDCRASIEKTDFLGDCSQATAVSSSYGRCIERLQDIACEEVSLLDSRGRLLPLLPPECIGVIKLE
jgi:hypothetical protein